MADYEQRLARLAESLDRGEPPERVSVRTLLEWFDSQRRGSTVVWWIRQTLAKHGLKTVPDFNSVYIDAPVSIVLLTPNEEPGFDSEGSAKSSTGTEEDGTTPIERAITDPTYRIGRLRTANIPLVSVKPDTSIKEAVTLMLLHDFSQLPVMQNERDIKGVVSWRSIGKRMALGLKCETARDSMESHHEVPSDASLLTAIDEIVRNEYVLIRSEQNVITGIVT